MRLLSPTFRTLAAPPCLLLLGALACQSYDSSASSSSAPSTPTPVTPPTPPTPVTLSTVAVTSATPKVNPGASPQFTATGSYSDGTSKDLTTQVSWTSSDPTVATIDASTGLGSALATGSTTLTATLDGVTGSTTLAVVPNRVTCPWSSQTPTLSPAIPSGLVTDFTGVHYGPNPWNYTLLPFTVDSTGNYAATSTTTPVVNTTYFLKGLFTPSALVANVQPATIAGNFIAEMFGGGFTTTFPTYVNGSTPVLPLTAGQQYTALVAFNSGGTFATDRVTLTITGPGNILFDGDF